MKIKARKNKVGGKRELKNKSQLSVGIYLGLCNHKTQKSSLLQAVKRLQSWFSLPQSWLGKKSCNKLQEAWKQTSLTSVSFQKRSCNSKRSLWEQCRRAQAMGLCELDRDQGRLDMKCVCGWTLSARPDSIRLRLRDILFSSCFRINYSFSCHCNAACNFM